LNRPKLAQAQYFFSRSLLLAQPTEQRNNRRNTEHSYEREKVKKSVGGAMAAPETPLNYVGVARQSVAFRLIKQMVLLLLLFLSFSLLFLIFQLLLFLY
jgi:hypothetical protein